MDEIAQQEEIMQENEVLSSTITSASIQAAKVPDFEPPQATISRIIKQVLPDNIQITREARQAFTRAAGIFIFYITQCANDYSKEHKRSTIYTQDVISALRELDFGEFEAPLEEFLEVYRKEQEIKKAPKIKVMQQLNDNNDNKLDSFNANNDEENDVEDEEVEEVE